MHAKQTGYTLTQSMCEALWAFVGVFDCTGLECMNAKRGLRC